MSFQKHNFISIYAAWLRNLIMNNTNKENQATNILQLMQNLIQTEFIRVLGWFEWRKKAFEHSS